MQVLPLECGSEAVASSTPACLQPGMFRALPQPALIGLAVVQLLLGLFLLCLCWEQLRYLVMLLLPVMGYIGSEIALREFSPGLEKYHSQLGCLKTTCWLQL